MDTTTTDIKPAGQVPALDSGALLGLHETREMLAYIAASPDREHGGFHPNAVLTAKSALQHLDDMDARLNRVRDMGEVYIYPSDWRCAKMGGPPEIDAYEKIDLSDA